MLSAATNPLAGDLHLGRGREAPPRARNTVCSDCSNAFSDPPGQLDWVTPTRLLSGNDLGVYAVSIGQKPKLLGKTGPVPFSVDASGDRVASGLFAPGCSGCSGPVKVLSVPSGAVVGLVGGAKADNSEPSLSPDGTQVVFARSPAKDSGPGPAIWTTRPTVATCSGWSGGQRPALVDRRQSNRLPRTHRGGSVGVAARGATGRC